MGQFDMAKSVTTMLYMIYLRYVKNMKVFYYLFDELKNIANKKIVK
jgi:hypothetical protein